MFTVNSIYLKSVVVSVALLLCACQAEPLFNSQAVEAVDRPAAENLASHVFVGAEIFTSSEKTPLASVMAISDDRIVYIGDPEGLEPFVSDSTITVDLQGKLILPGLIDAHTHPGYLAVYDRMIDLPEAKNREDQIEDIKILLAENADAEVIYAIGWDNRFFGTEGPSAAELDELESERPVLIFDITMHSLWVNSRALEVSGLGDDPVDPLPGVAYYKRDENGELTGYITEMAATLFASLFFEMGESEEATLLGYINYLSSRGVTSLLDAGNFGFDEEVYSSVKKLDERGALPMRYHGAYTLFLPNQAETALDELQRLAAAYNSENLKIDTLKVFFDGVVETRTAHMLQNYDDTPGNRGGSLFGVGTLTKLVVDLDQAGFNLHVHALGDQSSRTVLDAVEAARQQLGRPLGIRVAITHLQVIDPADFSRYAELDVIGQFTPAWHYYDQSFYAEALGERAKHPYPVAELMKEGATVNFSSDVYFPSEWADDSASPFTGIQVGHTRRGRESGPDDPASGPKSEQLSREAMVTGYTMGGAIQLGTEGALGSLEAGKKADFIVLGDDLFAMDPAGISEIIPEVVVLNGKRVQGQW
ncbi:amidohydrolase [Halieaceae bacterium IMCC8485]|jgi:predicted amidohydrolase YtcJ|uniref:Amidohydrolase n=1 Tax=Candidatus Seongchinamella marina TaxID=2518990 RepID=A0ABT3SQ92_9GAMM|nr:amidohydrolase [Candidatus Seongchinamella marina]MCX2972019.1 amidohydrolase [Candidatus Seongchinamella marina]